MEEKFHDAARDGKEEEVRRILKESLETNVHWKDSDGYAALHVACINGRDKIVLVLLAHPDIDVIQKDSAGKIPFLYACAHGRTSCVRLLLQDARVKVNEPANNGYTPLWCAASNEHLEVIKWWIASGREMDLGQPGNIWTNDAIGAAKKGEKPEVVSLLERFKTNPEKTRSEIRKELGIIGECAR